MPQAIDVSKIRNRIVDKEITLRLIESINHKLENGDLEETDGLLGGGRESYISVRLEQAITNLAFNWIKDEYADKGWTDVRLFRNDNQFPTTLRFYLE